ncbi:MAG: MarR family transcriptional regulator [Phycisphaerales bacterium]|nr:MAG: MarR family transcriptional regulator [Phycisphaerales bacterium]
MGERFLLRDLPKYESIEAHAAQCPELRPRAAQAWLELLRTGSDLLAVYDDMVRGYGLSQGRFTVLMLLSCDGEDGALPSALAERAGLSRAAMTGIIDALQSDGWIASEPNPEDRRSTRVWMTPEGVTRLDELLPGHFCRVAEVMSGLSASEQASLAELLGKLRLHLESTQPEPNRFDANQFDATRAETSRPVSESDPSGGTPADTTSAAAHKGDPR